MKGANIKVIINLLLVNVKKALLLFIPAWTLCYWQAWIVLGITCLSSLAMTIYLIKNDQDLLERRYRQGYVTENEKIQKTIHFFIAISLDAMFVLCAIDHHLGWSAIPTYLVVIGDFIVSLGFVIIFLVFKENTFASSKIEVFAEQRVISTGLYALLRHPLYAGGLIMRAGLPLALGAWSGFLIFIPSIFIFVQRIVHEEKFLAKNLPEYVKYQKLVGYRLLPLIW